MILAINANAAVDQVLFIERFLPGTVMRPTHAVTSVGGKALDSAVVLRALGAPVKALSFVAGRDGQRLAELVRERHIETDWIWLEGETRFSYVIVETKFNRHSHITTAGYTVTQEDCAVFKDHARRLAGEVGWAVIAGSLPGGAPETLYADIVALLNEAGVKTLADCFGAPARVVLEARPEVLKMNEAEFALTFGEQLPTRAERIQAARRLMDAHGLANFVLTCGKEGLLALTPEGVYHARSPEVVAVNAAGSGDAVSGVVAYRRWLGDGWDETLRWAAAAGAAVALTEGTAECRLADVERLLKDTVVQVID